MNNDMEQDDAGLERSASTWDMNTALHDEFRNNLQGHISDSYRNKLFNFLILGNPDFLKEFYSKHYRYYFAHAQLPVFF